MKRLTILTTALTCRLFADNSDLEAAPTPSQNIQNHHHFQVGPDFFWQHLCGKTNQTYEGYKYNIDYKQKSYFIGPRLEYRYLLPKAFYIDLQGTYADSTTKQTWLFTNSELNYKQSISRNSITSIFGNAEMSFGKIRQWKSFSLNDYFGIGWNYLKPNTEVRRSVDWYYVISGAQLNHSFSECFVLGLGANITYSFYVHEHRLLLHRDNSRVWGYGAKLPMTWNFGEGKLVSLKLEPYYQMLDTKNHLFNLGSRLELGVRF